MKRLLLLGGGHAQLAVLESLGRQPLTDAAVTLVAPADRIVYSGMLPGWVSGHYSLPACTIDLQALARAAGINFQAANVVAIDADARRVHLEGGVDLGYDVLSLNVGSLPAASHVAGMPAHAVPIRPLPQFIAGWTRVLEEAAAGRVREVSVVGGGAAGVELALAMAARFSRVAPAGAPHVRIFTEEEGILVRYPSLARHWLRGYLDRAGVGVHALSPVREIGADFIRIATTLTFSNQATFWVTGPAAAPMLRSSGLQVDESGFVAVNDFCQSLSHPEVFAAGDCATRLGAALPKSGVFAVRAGPALAANVRAAVAGGSLQVCHSRSRHLALLATGDRRAVGTWGGLSFAGRWAWRWKDRIDRAFVARYARLREGG